MSDPVTIDIPHQLGRAQARAKIDGGIGTITGFVPGGSLKERRWDGDTLHLVIAALGQRVVVRMDVLDTRVHAVIDLPPTVALFAGKIREKLQGLGTKLLR